MKRVAKGAIALVVFSLATGTAIAAPHLLRRMDSFRVRLVEVRGTRYMAPHEVLQASAITDSASVFDDFAPWTDSLELHPLIAHARIQRELPGTILLFIEEAQPIALVTAGGELRAATADGELLPLDPSGVDLDLPVVTSPALRDQHSVITNARLLAVLQVLERVRQNEPAMFGWISDAEPVTGGLRVRLRSPVGAQALLPIDPDALRLRQLRLTLADLAARKDMARLTRVDARFQGQIVVALTSTATS